MPELAEDDMADWVITFADPASQPEMKVRAAYPTTDEKLPGWTVLKDHRHKIVAMFAGAISVERLTTAAAA
jgi:hypothetical protein